MENINISELYNAQDIKTMQIADNSILPGNNRVEEIREFAKLSGYKKIGIANCISFQKEALILKDMLSNDFEVFHVDCKNGKLSNSEIIGENAKGISCNPSGQAAYLSKCGTEFNISLGLCVGHDLVFCSKSKAPTTTLLVKDRQNKHNGNI